MVAIIAVRVVLAAVIPHLSAWPLHNSALHTCMLFVSQRKHIHYLPHAVNERLSPPQEKSNGMQSTLMA